MNVLIHGIYGKMGKTLLEVLATEPNINISAGIDAKIPVGEAPLLFRDQPIPVFEAPEQFTGDADVIIDFSYFAAVPILAAFAAKKKIPMVICTTALGEPERKAMREASKSIPVFNSSNMSLGINVVARMSQLAIPALEPNFNVEIIEKHHNLKVDSPSGTALLIADAINEKCVEKKTYLYGRHGKDDKVKMSDLGIHAIRGGSLPGQHTVLFAGPDETIEITHTVYSRNVFALGALKAARFLIGKPPGMYSMEDIIG
jgi:4-hydroxy-tetrahydrodipicolinate reductase